jgi:hypothetical protein
LSIKVFVSARLKRVVGTTESWMERKYQTKTSLASKKYFRRQVIKKLQQENPGWRVERLDTFFG